MVVVEFAEGAGAMYCGKVFSFSPGPLAWPPSFASVGCGELAPMITKAPRNSVNEIRSERAAVAVRNLIRDSDISTSAN